MPKHKRKHVKTPRVFRAYCRDKQSVTIDSLHITSESSHVEIFGRIEISNDTNGLCNITAIKTVVDTIYGKLSAQNDAGTLSKEVSAIRARRARSPFHIS